MFRIKYDNILTKSESSTGHNTDIILYIIDAELENISFLILSVDENKKWS
jgi:hypothetical protein